MHGKVRLLAVHGHHLDGLACKSTNTRKVRGKVRTLPARPASLAGAAAAAAGGGSPGLRRGAAAAAPASAGRRLGPRRAPVRRSRDPAPPRALALRADGMHSSYT